MAVLELTVAKRDKAGKAKALRREGYIPATIYGPDFESQNIQLSAKDFSKVSFDDYNHIFHLKLANQDHEALIRNIQRNFLTREVLNIEFYKIKSGSKIDTKISLKFTGVAPAVKLGADLLTFHQEAHIRCLPRDLPDFIEVDLSSLKEFDDVISFADLKIDRSKIEVTDLAEDLICKVEEKRVDHSLDQPIGAALSAEDAAIADAAKAEAAEKAAEKKAADAKK